MRGVRGMGGMDGRGGNPGSPGEMGGPGAEGWRDIKTYFFRCHDFLIRQLPTYVDWIL